MEIREVLALNLRTYRQAQELSQEELAHRADIDRTYISALERCVYAASIDVVDRLARVLGVAANDGIELALARGGGNAGDHASPPSLLFGQAGQVAAYCLWS